MMNRVYVTSPNSAFDALVSTFSSFNHTVTTRMVIGYPERSSKALISLLGGEQDLCGILNIFQMAQKAAYDVLEGEEIEVMKTQKKRKKE